jgi:hypothetical protein
MSAFAHPAERLVSLSQVLFGRGGVPSDQLDLAGQLEELSLAIAEADPRWNP